jgi:predicted nucleotidyltransferase
MERPALIQEIRNIILRHAKPQRIYLYGSEVTGEAHDGSDIDIALDDPAKPDLEPIRDEIAQLPTLIKVDITNLAECETRFVNRVKSTGRPLFSATKALRLEDGLHNFENAATRFSSIVRLILER